MDGRLPAKSIPNRRSSLRRSISPRRRRSRSPSHRYRSRSRDNRRKEEPSRRESSSERQSGKNMAMQRNSVTLLSYRGSGKRPPHSSRPRSNEGENRRRDRSCRLGESGDETGSRRALPKDSEDCSSADERGDPAPARRHREREAGHRQTSTRDTALDLPHESRRTYDLERSRGEEKAQKIQRATASLRDRPLPSQADSFALIQRPAGHHRGDPGDGPSEAAKEVPNYSNTGRLAAATNAVARPDGTTVVLKYHEPPEARKPPSGDMWRLVIFKGEAGGEGHSSDIAGPSSQNTADMLSSIDLGLRSCWLIGREVTVVDLPAAHPSVSGQHAVIQFRYVESRHEGPGRVRPYLIDLESANGTRLNDKNVPESRYIEIRHGDVIRVGHSSREYVVVRAQPVGKSR